MAIEEAEESDDEIEINEKERDVVKVIPMSKRIIHEVEWVGEPAMEYKGRKYYDKVKVGEFLNLNLCEINPNPN